MKHTLFTITCRDYAEWLLLSALRCCRAFFVGWFITGVVICASTGALAQTPPVFGVQSPTLDSLHTAWQGRAAKKSLPDSAGVMLLAAISEEYALRNPTKAEVYAREASSLLAASPMVSSPVLNVYCGVRLAAALLARGRNAQAEVELERILPFAQNLSTVMTADPMLSKARLLAEIYLFQASIAFDKAKRTDALQLYKQSLAEAERSGDELLIVKALCGAAGVESFLARYAEYNEHIRRALRYAQKPTHYQNAALARIRLVQSLFNTRLSILGLAIESALVALKFYEQAGWRVLEAEALNVLLLALRLQFERVIEPSAEAQFEHYLERALKMFQEFDNKRGLLMVYTETGLKFENQKRYDSALVYDRKLLSIAQEVDSKHDIIVGAINVGILLWRTGKPDSAMAFLQRALRLAEESQSMRMMIVPSVRISSILRQDKRQPALALTYAQRGLHLADSLKNISRKQYALIELAAVYDSLRRYDDAYRAMLEAYSLRDSVYSKESSDKVAQLQIEYQTERKDNEILLLQKNQELQAFVLARQQSVQYWLVGTLAGVLVVALWLWRLYRQKERASAEIAKQKILLEEQTQLIQRSNDELFVQNEQLSSLNIEKTEIMGIVSHDLKNPISAVRGFGELIESGILTNEELASVAHHIVHTSERMLDLVKKLLDMNQLEAGGMEFQKVEFNILLMVEGIVRQFEAQAAAKQITIHYSSKLASCRVIADEQAIEQVLDNLLSNAVKYSPHGKNVFVSVRYSSDENLHFSDQVTNAPMINGYVRLEVEDEGPGISENDHAKLFEKFSRLSARPTGGEHSTGLGLSIVKKIVEAMNGKVWCESELGKGTTFIVELPVA